MPRKLKKPWLNAYEDYVAQSESPIVYNTWCAISAISSVLKNNVFHKHGLYTIYPNQYVILVGPPGVGKGTAIHPVVGLVKEAQSANYISDRISAEELVRKLKDGFNTTRLIGGKLTTNLDSTATIVSTELPIFVQTSEWMLPLMCEMWDRNEFDYQTKTKGSYVAKNLCVSLIAGCVPDYIRKLNRDANAAVTGGFTSRCMFAYASDKSKKIAWPTNNGQFGQLKDDLIEDLKDIATMSGEVTFTKNARDCFERWYSSHTTDQFATEVLIGFDSRVKAHVLKTAIVLSASESNNGEITEQHIREAISLVSKIRGCLDITFRSVGESPLAVAQQRVLEYIEKKGTANRADISRTLYRHLTDDQLSQALYILELAGKIIKQDVGGKIHYRGK